MEYYNVMVYKGDKAVPIHLKWIPYMAIRLKEERQKENPDKVYWVEPFKGE